MNRDVGNMLNSWRNPSKAHLLFSFMMNLWAEFTAGHSFINFNGAWLVYAIGTSRLLSIFLSSASLLPVVGFSLSLSLGLTHL